MLAPEAHLPAPVSTLIGRNDDLAHVEALLLRPDTRLLTISGPGGVGKTRLALAVAHAVRERFRDGVVLTRLEAIRDPALLFPTLAQASGLQEQASQSIDVALTSFLRTKQALFVLDNMEQVVTAAPLLVDLLAACPDLTLLVTSRTVLRVSGEQIFLVQPLPLPELSHPLALLPDEVVRYSAVQLFVSRAQAAQPGFTLTPDNSSTVAAICQRLDGLPLALELAAARIALFSPHALLARLDRRLPLLTSGARDHPARLQTLRGAIDWSYVLLTPDEQCLFRQLAVYVGGCTFAAAEAVCSAVSACTVDVTAGIETLVDHHLLQRMDTAESEPRFRMLETIREFALEQLAAADEEIAVRRANAHYLLALGEAAEQGLRSANQQRWRDHLEEELGNIRAALAWTTSSSPDAQDRDIGLRLAGALWYFWLRRGLPTEGRQWMAQALAASSAGGAPRARALLGSGALAWQQGDYLSARNFLAESLTVWENAPPDETGLAETLHILGHVYFDQREYSEARRLFEASLARYEQTDNDSGKVTLIGDVGMVAYHERDDRRARDLFADSLRRARQHGLKDREAEALNRLGDLDRLAGDAKTASKRYEESLLLWQELRGNPGIASALHKLGQVSRLSGDLASAHARFIESLALQREVGNRQGTAECLAGLAGIALDNGMPERAAQLLATSISLLEAMGAPLAPADQSVVASDIRSGRLRLGEIAWEAAWGEGRNLLLDQMLDEALGMPPMIVTPASAAQNQKSLLSRREHEVVALVALGLTNRAIAERLVIGERTVETHVSRILAKLGFTSRSQVVAWAIQHERAGD